MTVLTFGGLALALCVSFVVTVVVIPIVIRVAHKRGWFDRIDGRKIHVGDVPRLGGIAIYLGVLVAIIVSLAFGDGRSSQFHLAVRSWIIMIAGSSLMFGVGLVDDFKNIPALQKLIGQLVAAAVIAASGFRLDLIAVPFTNSSVSLGWSSYPFTVIWIVAIANSVNLIDGMDGFAGGVGLIASAIFASVASIEGNGNAAIMSLALFGAAGGFLLFNRPPARIFMGDSGSLLLGTLLATIPLAHIGGGSGPAPVNLLLAATVLLIPIYDTISAIVRRARRRAPIHQPDSEHLHHKLLQLLRSTRYALSVLYLFQIVLGTAAVVSVYLSHVLSAAVLLLAFLVSAAFFAGTQSIYLRRVVRRKVDHSTESRMPSDGSPKVI